jgi:hypothetical protein
MSTIAKEIKVGKIIDCAMKEMEKKFEQHNYLLP